MKQTPSREKCRSVARLSRSNTATSIRLGSRLKRARCGQKAKRETCPFWGRLTLETTPECMLEARGEERNSDWPGIRTDRLER